MGKLASGEMETGHRHRVYLGLGGIRSNSTSTMRKSLRNWAYMAGADWHKHTVGPGGSKASRSIGAVPNHESWMPPQIHPGPPVLTLPRASAVYHGSVEAAKDKEAGRDFWPGLV